MKKNSCTFILIGATLIVAVILIVKAVGPRVSAATSQPYVGFGDLRLVEALQSSSAIGTYDSTRPYTGFGDLHRFEAQKYILKTWAPESSRQLVGMGDLHLFEDR